MSSLAETRLLVTAIAKCLAPALAFVITMESAAADASAKPMWAPETAETRFVPNAERLEVNTSPATRMVVALTRAEALMQIRGLADRSTVEEQWVLLSDHDLWVELGINESADEAGSQVEIDSELLERLLSGFDRIDFYHFHPRYYFERLGGGAGFALTTPAAALSPGQLEAVGLALPSPADVNASVEIAIMAEAINPAVEIRHFVVSMFGVASYGPTHDGQQKLARERGYPFASLRRELEVASTLRRGALGMESMLRARPGLSVHGLLVEACNRMSGEMYLMSFEAHEAGH